jgi:hypothetical protein
MSEVGHAPAQSSARPTPSRASVSSRLGAQLPEYRPRPQVAGPGLNTRRIVLILAHIAGQVNAITCTCTACRQNGQARRSRSCRWH